MARSIYTFLFLLFSLSSFAQKKVKWEDLTTINYKWEYSLEYETWYEKPLFNQSAKNYDGQTVLIKGFIIPYDAEGNKYFLSLYPNSTCFFCDQAGKETVMQLNLKNIEEFTVDQVVTMKGRLRLEKTPFEMPYILDDAVVVD